MESIYSTTEVIMQKINVTVKYQFAEKYHRVLLKALKSLISKQQYAEIYELLRQTLKMLFKSIKTRSECFYTKIFSISCVRRTLQN